MSIKSIKTVAAAILIAAVASALAPTGTAELTASSKPSGFYKLELLGNSDTVVSMPYLRPIEGSGLVASINGNVIEVAGANWAPGQFVYAPPQHNTYMVLIHGGAKEGSFYLVTANTPNTLTVQLNGDVLDQVAAGDRVVVIPYWTLNTVFPGGRGVHTTLKPGNRLTEVLIPDLNAVGMNPSASKIYYFYQGHWKQVGQGTVIKDDDVLAPDAYFLVRHNIDQGTTITTSGGIVMSKWAIPLTVRDTTKQDNVAAIPRPRSYSLNESDLVSSGAFTPSPKPGSRTDELLVFDNTVAAKNKSAAAIYYYWSGAWRKVGGGTADYGSTVVFTPGTGVIIRKAIGTESPVWVQEPGY